MERLKLIHILMIIIFRYIVKIDHSEKRSDRFLKLEFLTNIVNDINFLIYVQLFLLFLNYYKVNINFHGIL